MREQKEKLIRFDLRVCTTESRYIYDGKGGITSQFRNILTNRDGSIDEITEWFSCGTFTNYGNTFDGVEVLGDRIMEDWEEDYFTEEAWSNAKKAAFIIGCSIMAWVGIGLL